MTSPRGSDLISPGCPPVLELNKAKVWSRRTRECELARKNAYDFRDQHIKIDWSGQVRFQSSNLRLGWFTCKLGSSATGNNSQFLRRLRNFRFSLLVILTYFITIKTCLLDLLRKFSIIFVAPKIHYFAPKINIFSFCTRCIDSICRFIDLFSSKITKMHAIIEFVWWSIGIIRARVIT